MGTRGQPMSSKRLYLTVLASVILLAGVLVSARLFRPSVRAHNLLAQVGTLEVGKSTFGEAQTIAIRIGAIPSDPCTSVDCRWYVRIDNSGLPERWRGAGTTFSAQFQIKNSVVTE